MQDVEMSANRTRLLMMGFAPRAGARSLFIQYSTYYGMKTSPGDWMLPSASASSARKIFSGCGLPWLAGDRAGTAPTLSDDLRLQQILLAACSLPELLVQEAGLGHGNTSGRSRLRVYAS
jgi:hypothetical protein